MSNKCKICGNKGHNSRTCKSSATNNAQTNSVMLVESEENTVAKKPKKVEQELESELSEIAGLDDTLDDTSNTEAVEGLSDFTTGSEELSETVESSAPSPEPGLQVEIPLRRRSLSKAESAFWAATEKKLAPDSIASAGELAQNIPRISTGNFGLDVATYGGIPQGRILRFWGQPKSGKTGSCLNVVAQYQREHCSECFQKECSCPDRDVPEVVWVDAENRMNSMLYWPKSHGINLDCFRILCPPTGQNVVDFVDHIIREQKTAKIGLIVVDSLAHIVSQEMLNKATMDGPTVGRDAFLLNAAWKKWTSAVHSLGIKNDRKPTILCINQIRQKVGVVYGSNEIMPGGIGQDFATSIDLRFSSGQPSYVVFDEKKNSWVAKQKGMKSTFKPPADATPDFVTINYRVTASGICPSGRFGEFNYWLKSAHGHRCGDPDNGLQLWQYCKRYELIEQGGGQKSLFGLTGRTYDELEKVFRSSPEAQKQAWSILLEKLCR